MTRSHSLCFFLYRISRGSISTALLFILGLAWLYPVALAADRATPQINPQLQRPLDIPLERLERPLRTPPVPIKPVNLNTASIEQLVTLPGVSTSTAQQIVEGRPYQAKSDLADKHILSDAAYDRIKSLITIE